MKFFLILSLSFIQGVSEFFPVSSSAHLFYLKNLFGLVNSTNQLVYFLHIGTLFSVIFFFRKDFFIFFNTFLNSFKLSNRLRVIYKYNHCTNFNFLLNIVISTATSAFVGIFLKLVFNDIIFSKRIIAHMLLISGTVLTLTKLKNKKFNFARKLRLTDSILIGLLQGLSIMPGLSRLGITLSFSIIIGLDYKFSLKYSFFLSVPIILGVFFFDVTVLDIKNFEFDLYFIFLGIIISSLVGYFSLKCFFYVKKDKIYLFGFYCYTLSLIILFFF